MSKKKAKHKMNNDEWNTKRKKKIENEMKSKLK